MKNMNLEKLFFIFSLFFSAVIAANADIFINEVQSSNDSTCFDSDGDAPDWIELYNSGGSAVDLTGWGLSDNANRPFKWTFPNGTTIGAGKYLKVFASAKSAESDVSSPEISAIDPSALDGKVLWLRADDMAAVGDGNAVRSWTDASGRNNTMTQSTESRRPIYTANAVNGHAALKFTNSSNSALQRRTTNFNGLNSFSNITVFAVYQWTGATVAGLLSQYSQSSSTANVHLEIKDNGVLRFRVADVDISSSSGHEAIGEWRFLTAEIDYAPEIPNVSVFSNGKLSMSANKSIGTQRLDMGDYIYVGASLGSGRGFSGYIAEMIIFNRALDNQDRDGVSKFLSEKFGIGASNLKSDLHTSFKLSSDGETLTLTSPAGTVVDTLTFGQVPCDTSYGRSPDGSQNLVWFATPTPGSANSTTAYGAPLAPVKFSKERGIYSQAFSLTLSHDDPDATIIYTTDLSDPTADHGTVYRGETITVSRTGAIRATAVKTGAVPYRNIATHTYLFLDNVPQDIGIPDGCPATWSSYGSCTARYGISTNVVKTAANRTALRTALTKLPVIAITAPWPDLFDASTGLYTHPGEDWEIAASCEWLTNGVGRLQLDAGLGIQGGASRNFSNSAKKSFQIHFRGKYGAGSLPEPIFDDRGFPDRDLNSISLRADYNNSWIHSNSDQRQRGSLIRDQWARDTQLAMSGFSSSGNHAHLFINGRYWGIYNACERVNAGYGAHKFGGESFEYDAIAGDDNNSHKVRSGNVAAWSELTRRINSGLSSNNNFRQVEEMLDIDAFIDYMLVNFYGGNQDWPHHNWVAVRRRTDDGKFRFCCWDTERTLEGTSDNVTGKTTGSGPGLFQGKLIANAEYCRRFADRAYRHLNRGGAMTVEANRARYRSLAEWLRPAIYGEVARWGDYRNASSPYSISSWETNVFTVTNTYFSARGNIFISQLAAKGLYPALEAPVITANGQTVTIGHESGATIYYAFNSDPREDYTAAIGTNAVLYTGAVNLTKTATVTARAYQSGNWSAPVSLTVAAGQPLFLPAGDGDWGIDDNWEIGIFPNAAGAGAIIPEPQEVDAKKFRRSVTLKKELPITIGQLTFNNGASTNRIVNKSGSPLVFDNAGSPASITVTGTGEHLAVLDLEYETVTLNSDLIIDTVGTAGSEEYGALRLQDLWGGDGGVTKVGAGRCSVTGVGKNWAGATAVNAGVLAFTANAVPNSSSAFTVADGGQLRLISGGTATYRFPQPLQLTGYGATAGNGALGALRADPENNQSTITVSSPVTVSGGTGIHVEGHSNRLKLSGGIGGSGGLRKTGGGVLEFPDQTDLPNCALEVAVGTAEFVNGGSVAAISGNGTVAVTAGQTVCGEVSEVRLAATLQRFGLSANDNGTLALDATNTLPRSVTVYIGDADWHHTYCGALSIPDSDKPNLRLCRLVERAYAPDEQGEHEFNGSTWSVVPMNVNVIRRNGVQTLAITPVEPTSTMMMLK